MAELFRRHRERFWLLILRSEFLILRILLCSSLGSSYPLQKQLIYERSGEGKDFSPLPVRASRFIYPGRTLVKQKIEMLLVSSSRGQIFRAANEPLHCGSRYNIRICEIG